MPSRNTIKTDVPNAYYHAYARGASKQMIFRDSSDYMFFMSLFARHLSIEQQVSRLSVYPHLRGELELLAFCLMPNHVHLLFYQAEQGAMAKLMQCMLTSYSLYFNRKYHTSGSVFESRYKASMIAAEPYLLHISRYIHLNPRYYKHYPYSSYRYYIRGGGPEWLQTGKISELFASPQVYTDFVSDYEEAKTMLDQIKHELADT